MKKVLGLDIGTNSIGAALVNLPIKFEDYGKNGDIVWIGSRIIPTDADYLMKFESGQTAGMETKAASRRSKRGSRRLKHRYKLRRTRLVKVFKFLGWINENFPLDDPKSFKKKINEDIDFKFSINTYLPFSQKTIEEFKEEMGILGKKRIDKNKEIDYQLPEDWVVYYLREKALTKRIEIVELVRIIYMMNQRRGFKSSRKDLKESAILTYDEFIKRIGDKEYNDEGLETQFVSITKISSVSFKEEIKDKRGNTSSIYTISTEDSRIETWEEIRKKKPDWVGKEVTFLITQKIDKNGKLHQNKPQIPKEDNWALCTTALDERINSKIYPGSYFFSELKKASLENRNFKIRQFPVYRWRYKKELEDIWNKQCELNPEIKKINSDPNILRSIAEILYPTQTKFEMSKLSEFKNHDLLHIISNDIIYYNRELKTQKNSISECKYEKRKGIDGETYGLKCIPRSSPLFQEFRIWQDIHNIRVLEKEAKVDGKTRLDVDVTVKFINEKVKEKLFQLFNSKPTIKEKNILELLQQNISDNNIKLDINKKDQIHSHRINLYANRNELKGNEILNRYRDLFKKANFNGEEVLCDKEKLLKLWHIDYSITSSDEEKSKKGITTALNNLFGHKIKTTNLIDIFCKLPEIKKEYGSYSAKMIKKILPLMRCGIFWNKEDISDTTKDRAQQIQQRLIDINYDMKRLSEIADDDVKMQVLKSFIQMEDFTKGLGTHQASYLLYDKHSEKTKISINSVEEFRRYILKEFPNNCMRNPIVEKIVRETMVLVCDIWKKYGDINEIHIELGRELKSNAHERKKMADVQKSNFNEKQRIKNLLYELLNEGFDQYIDSEDSAPLNWKTEIELGRKFEVNPNPENSRDIDKFRVWKSLSQKTDNDWEKKLKDENIPSEQQAKKYALWLSQNCRSPYTGRIIPLSKLFDSSQYEIEHIIPRRRMKNDSFNNLVIAELGVNKAKDNMLAANFISNSNGKCIYGGTEYKLFHYQEYDSYCKETFRFQNLKKKNLLATDVPEDFVQRQLNDTRYIGTKLSELLAPITKNMDGTYNENGILFTGGSITSELKKNWGFNDIWKEILRPRFERLETILKKDLIILDKTNPNKFHFDLRENSKLELKRLDHRHHALDALIIATTTREHIRYLNTLNASDSDEAFRLNRKTLVKGKIREFKEPWANFSKCAKDKLEELIVTFKTNSSVISKPRNTYKHGYTDRGNPIEFQQKKNVHWMAVRRSMFKEPQGIVNLKEVYEEKSIIKAVEIQIDRMLAQDMPVMKLTPYIYNKEARKIIKDLIDRVGISITEKDLLLNEIKQYLIKNKLRDFSGNEYKSIEIAIFQEYAAKRVKLDKSFDHKKIDKIPYSKNGKSVLGKLLHAHLDSSEYEGKPELAFSGEGLESLEKKSGKFITKVTIVEKKDSNSKFGKKYVEVDAGANAYFIMYENQATKERVGFLSISTHKAIERFNDRDKTGIADQREGYDLIILSPGDLVYVPTKDEMTKINKGLPLKEAIDMNDRKNIASSIYKMTDTTQGKCLFVPHRISSIIGEENVELGAGNKSARAWNGKVEYITNSKGKLSREDSGDMIKDVCIKLKVDRLGNIIF